MQDVEAGAAQQVGHLTRAIPPPMPEVLVMAAEQPRVCGHVHRKHAARRQHVVDPPHHAPVVVEMFDDVQRDDEVGGCRGAERVAFHVGHAVAARRIETLQQGDGGRVDVEARHRRVWCTPAQARNSPAAPDADDENAARLVTHGMHMLMPFLDRIAVRALLASVLASIVGVAGLLLMLIVWIARLALPAWVGEATAFVVLASLLGGLTSLMLFATASRARAQSVRVLHSETRRATQPSRIKH